MDLKERLIKYADLTENQAKTVVDNFDDIVNGLYVTKERLDEIDKDKIVKGKIEMINEALEKQLRTHYPLNKKGFNYNYELHDLFLKTMVELHNYISTLKTCDYDIISKYQFLLNDLKEKLNDYLKDCFSIIKYNQSMLSHLYEESNNYKLECLLINLNKINIDSNETKDKNYEILLEQKRNQLLPYLYQYKNIFSEKCSTFNVYNKSITSKIIELMNTFEDENYGFFEYSIISDIYDAHGKSSDGSAYVFHPAKINYQNQHHYYRFSQLNDLLESSKHEYINWHEFTPEKFKNFPYVKSFLKKLAEWRFEHYFLNFSKCRYFPETFDPFKFPIPEEILDVITQEFIKSKKPKVKQKEKTF